jgi:hypothetical protein
MRVIAVLDWHYDVASKRGASLQLNDVAARGFGQNLLDTLPSGYHPRLSAGGSIFQRALHVLSRKLRGTIGIPASGRGRLIEDRSIKRRSRDQQKKNNPWCSHTPTGNLHVYRPFPTMISLSANCQKCYFETRRPVGVVTNGRLEKSISELFDSNTR